MSSLLALPSILDEGVGEEEVGEEADRGKKPIYIYFFIHNIC